MSVPTIKIPNVSGGCNAFIKQGDTINEIVLEFDTGVDLTTSTIKMQVFNGSNKVYDVSNGNGITVNSALKMTIDEVSASDNNFPVGNSIGDLQITDVNGKVNTYCNFEYKISEEYTR